MPVRYITVTPITDLFVPATQSFSDIAIVGAVDTDALGPKKVPVPVTNPLQVSFNVPPPTVESDHQRRDCGRQRHAQFRCRAGDHPGRHDDRRSHHRLRHPGGNDGPLDDGNDRCDEPECHWRRRSQRQFDPI